MSVLLLEGFADDEVVVRVDDREVDRRAGVTTSPLVGMAAELSLQVAEDAQELAVAVPARALESATRLPEGDARVLAEVGDHGLAVWPGSGREGGM